MKKCVILSGAGISADSGLKTFRDAGGLWEGYKVEEVCTPEAYARNPQLVIDFYNHRRRQANAAQPNEAHKALVALEPHYRVEIVTQNVDDLHERAGSQSVLHLHGELNKVRSCVNADEVMRWTGDQEASDCDAEGYPLRPHIVWFGEDVPMFGDAVHLMEDADIVIVIGTSLNVYPAASLLRYAPAHAEVYLIDPNPGKLDVQAEIIPQRAKDGVPTLVSHLINIA
ncbi:MAG: Sir2 family NAD-dependent protein deacetylase [Neisseria sp.]